jgi:ornithine carbamoyltransferase
MKKDLLKISDYDAKWLESVIELAEDVKKNKEKYENHMHRKTLLMFFEKPSLRTRVSFETGMTQMGGHAIYYDISTSPMGKKETIKDTAIVASRYADIMMARMYKNEDVKELAQYATVPVINGLDDLAHPTQIVADLLTIKEKKGKFKGLKFVYAGDCENNVTYSLMEGCVMLGMDVYIVGPKEMMPKTENVEIAEKLAKQYGGKLTVTNDMDLAFKDADIVYTDSWMSYHISKDEKEARLKVLMPYQVTSEMMNKTKEDSIFMNCLPAMRGQEQTAEVIDDEKHSVVFDEAENRLHAHKAIMLRLLGLA